MGRTKTGWAVVVRGVGLEAGTEVAGALRAQAPSCGWRGWGEWLCFTVPSLPLGLLQGSLQWAAGHFAAAGVWRGFPP